MISAVLWDLVMVAAKAVFVPLELFVAPSEKVVAANVTILVVDACAVPTAKAHNPVAKEPIINCRIFMVFSFSVWEFPATQSKRATLVNQSGQSPKQDILRPGPAFLRRSSSKNRRIWNRLDRKSTRLNS